MKECHKNFTTAFSLDELNETEGGLCNGQRKFDAVYIPATTRKLDAKFKAFVTSIKGKENIYIVLGGGE